MKDETRTQAQYDWLRANHPDLFDGAVQAGHIPALHVYRGPDGFVVLPADHATSMGARVEATVVGLLCRALGMPR